MAQSRRQRQAVEHTERIVRAASREAEDPGLRSRFPSLPRAPIKIICSAMDKAINHGNILRVADAFRVEEVCFAPVPPSERDFSGCRAALDWVPVRWIDPAEAIAEAKSAGWHIYGLTLAPNAVSIHDLRWKHPAAIVLGRELEGLPPELASQCETLVGIPMYGMVTSLNVAVSAAIAVSSCLQAYVAAHPEFLPARRASRELILKHRTPHREPWERPDESLS